MTDESLTDRLARIKSTAEGSVAAMAADDRGMLSEVRLIGGGLVMMLIVTLVLTEVYESVDFETDTDGNYTGPFGDVVASLESTGVAAMTLLVVGFLVVAASAIMRFFGRGFGSGGR